MQEHSRESARAHPQNRADEEPQAGSAGAVREDCRIGVLFADVAGSTRLYEIMGDREALAAIAACLEAASLAVAARGGRIVKTIGDEIMAAFEAPGAVLDAAIDIQRAISELPALRGPQGEHRLSLRIGFSYGPAIRTNDDVFGTTVNMAARMVAFAKGGQIITTGDFLDFVEPGARGSTRDLDTFRVKGRSDEIGVVEVLWQSSTELTVLTRAARPSARAARTVLRLRHGERELVLQAGGAAVTLGREPGNDLVVPDHCASRAHATIDRRRDKWVLVDHSTNGTFVRTAGQPEICLRHEEIVLGGSGTIGLGRSGGSDPSFDVHFSVDV